MKRPTGNVRLIVESPSGQDQITVDVRRDSDNPNDKNAVALHAPGADDKFGYVQRGRAAGIARRLDAGESLAGVSMRGPRRGRDDDTAFIVLGSLSDIAAMLSE